MNPPAFIPARIAVHMPNWIGDVVMATPMLRMLRKKFDDARIALVMRPYAADLISGSEWVDTLISVDERKVGGLLRGVRDVRRFRPDTSLVLSHSTRPAFMARLSGASRRLGYERGGRGRLFTDTMHLPEKNGGMPEYMGRQYTVLAEMLGCAPDNDRPELPVLQADEVRADDILSRHHGDGPLIGLAPGASFGGSKLWPPERFAATANNLITRKNARIVMPVAPSETHIRDRIMAGINEPAAIIDVGTPDVSLLKSIVKRTNLLITSDSGVRHVAIAFDIPTVVLMGPTRPEYTDTPFERGTVIRHDVECGPCHEPKCPGDHICMDLITVDEVTAAAYRLVTDDMRG